MPKAIGQKEEESGFKRFSQHELDLINDAMEEIINVVGETADKIFQERRRRALLSNKNGTSQKTDDLFYVLPMLLVLDCNYEEDITNGTPICPN